MSKELLKKDRRITAAQAVKMLKEDGREVTEKEAEEILDLLYVFAKLTVNQYVNDNYDKGKKS